MAGDGGGGGDVGGGADSGGGGKGGGGYDMSAGAPPGTGGPAPSFEPGGGSSTSIPYAPSDVGGTSAPSMGGGAPAPYDVGNYNGLGGLDTSYLGNTGGTAAPAGGGATPGGGTSPFDVGNYGGLNGLDTSYLNQGTGPAPGGATTSFPEGLGATTPNAPTAGSPVAGLPGVGGGTPDLTQQKPGGGGGGGGSGMGDVMSSLGVKNPLQTAIGAAGLGYSMFQGQQPPKFSPEMQAAASKLDANGQQLMSYLQSGNLPPGLKTSLDQATSAAKTKIISNFASQGLNTDPNQNSVLAQQLAQVDQQAIISTAQIGQQLMQSGLAQSGLSSDLYKTLANIDQTQTANIGKAIANFASAVSGGGGGINLKLV